MQVGFCYRKQLLHLCGVLCACFVYLYLCFTLHVFMLVYMCLCCFFVETAARSDRLPADMSSNPVLRDVQLLSACAEYLCHK